MTSDPAKAMELKVVPLEISDGRECVVWSRWTIMRGLVWCEWYMHSKLLLFFLSSWLVCVWVLPVFVNPAWILLFGAVFAVVAGPVYGGSDTIEGCEEFTFSQAPTRRERYLARLATGGGALLTITAIDLLALGLDLPQVLAKLSVASGLIRPWPVVRSGLLYGLVLALPVAVFAISFVIAAITRSRAAVFGAPFWAVLIGLATLRLGFWYEELVWERLNGWFSCPLLIGMAILAVWGGYYAYERKEIGQQNTPLAIPVRWWLWIVLFVAGLVLALTLAASIVKHYSQHFA
jgi:hypothetical protein